LIFVLFSFSFFSSPLSPFPSTILQVCLFFVYHNLLCLVIMTPQSIYSFGWDAIGITCFWYKEVLQQIHIEDKQVKCI
jgi:hypothetical protein